MEVTDTKTISSDNIKNSVDFINNIGTLFEVREANICDCKVYSVINTLRGTCVKIKITTDNKE